jgi:hypothetical protein
MPKNTLNFSFTNQFPPMFNIPSKNICFITSIDRYLTTYENEKKVFAFSKIIELVFNFKPLIQNIKHYARPSKYKVKNTLKQVLKFKLIIQKRNANEKLMLKVIEEEKNKYVFKITQLSFTNPNAEITAKPLNRITLGQKQTD